MNAAHLHLLINHLPVVGLLFALGLLLAAQLRKSGELARAGIAAIVLVAAIAIPVYLTGEPAEEVVEDLPGISESAIEPHEEAALIGLISLEVLGALAVVGLVAFRDGNPGPRWYLPTLLALTLLVAGWFAWTANLGGRITHEVARPGFTAPAERAED